MLVITIKNHVPIKSEKVKEEGLVQKLRILFVNFSVCLCKVYLYWSINLVIFQVVIASWKYNIHGYLYDIIFVIIFRFYGSLH